MKKLLTIFMLVFVMILVGCTDTKAGDETTAATQEVTTDENVTAEETTTPEQTLDEHTTAQEEITEETTTEEETTGEESNTNEIPIVTTEENTTAQEETTEEETDNEEADLSAVFEKYDDYEKWNFKVDYKVTVDSYLTFDYVYNFMGADFTMIYDYEGVFYTDYIIYDSDYNCVYYADAGDGTYIAISDYDDEFYEYMMYVDYLELCELNKLSFNKSGDCYVAESPMDAGNQILGEYDDNTWTKVELYIEDGKIVKITAEADALDYDTEEYVHYDYEITFEDYGKVSFDVSDLIIGSGEDFPTIPEGTVNTVFTDKNLGVEEGGLTFTTNGIVNGFDSNRGLQFLQAGGEVALTTAASMTDVTFVSAVVATNCDSGMKVSVYVGSTQLTCDGEGSVTVAKQSTFTELTTLVFSADKPISGKVMIVLTPTAESKSMYISSAEIVCSGSDNADDTTTSEKMPAQVYNKDKLDSENLQDKMMSVEGVIGLPSTGTYSCLVVPVQFSNTKISDTELRMLEIAFNGTSEQTGWESVKTYYQKSSYGKLDLSFDIQDVYVSDKTSEYYRSYSKEVDLGNGYTITQSGSEVLLLEVLSYLEDKLDLTEYDTNGDGCIDAVYLIYSEDVDYKSEDPFYWAYVTNYVTNEEENMLFDGLDAYYYLFAGLDFMYEDADSSDGFEYGGTISGIKVNASTYIHETGHLLGLSDYYDYYPGEGSDEGLGYADMMDGTMGDHNSYSKLMLGWVDPTIITSSQTVSIVNSESEGDFIMLLLDYNDSYFCEYLIIDLYTADGLNTQTYKLDGTSITYPGAEYGVRIYHVTSFANDPFNNDFVSFTDCNNSLTDIPLIKLIEADGETKFESTDGLAVDNDLWQAGDRFSDVYPEYTRNDGMLLNFDIVIDSVSAEGASITITFN